jgi:hypothetical protein
MVTGNHFSGRVWIYRGKPSDTPNFVYLLPYLLVKSGPALGPAGMDERATLVSTPASLLGVTSDGRTVIVVTPKRCVTQQPRRQAMGQPQIIGTFLENSN